MARPAPGRRPSPPLLPSARRAGPNQLTERRPAPTVPPFRTYPHGGATWSHGRAGRADRAGGQGGRTGRADRAGRPQVATHCAGCAVRLVVLPRPRWLTWSLTPHSPAVAIGGPRRRHNNVYPTPRSPRLLPSPPGCRGPARGRAGLTPKPHHAQQPKVALRGSLRLRLASTCNHRPTGVSYRGYPASWRFSHMRTSIGPGSTPALAASHSET